MSGNWVTVLRVVAICGLFGLIAQLLLAFGNSSLMSWFPPLFPQLLILAVLAVVAFIYGEAGILRRVLVGVCAGAVLITGLMGFYALGYSNTRSQTVCIYAYRDLPDEQRAEISLPEDLLARPKVEFSWPGNYTCVWPSDVPGGEEVRYTRPVYSLINHLTILFV